MPSSKPRSSTGSASKASSSSKSLNDYQLGDSLGKGAFGQVYRALNWATGETVAVKEITLSNMPKAELGEIMSEIDLLKNLNHPNIVKYKGFVKTREYLYIILEFCENGSLHAFLKRFGKFPEPLVAVYISQVLDGLVYLHDQGVIHRDIKGANILTNKDGTVKLADFGVASNTTAGGVRDDAVVGSPYWMAPEVIEQSGATTASDIWSVGCLVIELLEGHPPYHFLDPMPALFRIVQDDCPPIPDGASPVVKDFLYRCFQKDCNLRISAKKLLKHPWMVAARKQMTDGRGGGGKGKGKGDAADPKAGGSAAGTASGTEGSGARRPANYNYDEAVQKVQEWNEALRSPSRPSKHPTKVAHHPLRPTSPLHFSPHSHPIEQQHHQQPVLQSLAASVLGHNQQHRTPEHGLSAAVWKLSGAAGTGGAGAGMGMGMGVGLNLAEKKIQPLTLVTPEEQTDNWDDDFEEGISFTKLQALEKPTNGSSSGASGSSSGGGGDEQEKHEREDNAKTIRPLKSPTEGGTALLAKTPTGGINAIVEDYSDLASEEDESWLEEKVADFKIRNSSRMGLFHPDDISAFGLGPSAAPAGPQTAPLPSGSNSKSGGGGGSGGSSAPSGKNSKSRPSLNKTFNAPTSVSNPGSGSSSAASSLRGKGKGGSGGGMNGSFGRSASVSSVSSILSAATQGQGQGQGFDKYAEDDDEDYEDVFGKLNNSASSGQTIGRLQLNKRLSNKSWDDDSDEEDPFAEIDEGLSEDDLETNLQRDKYARLCNTVNGLIDQLTPSAPDFQLKDVCDQLLTIIDETPEMQMQLVSSHGMLAILEVLEGKYSREYTLKLLQIINRLVNADLGFLESFCLIGGIPVMMEFTSKKYAPECRLEASHFIRLLCHTSVLTLQMFISCRGLRVLVDLLDEDYAEQTELVVHALNGIGSVFELQSPTTKNDFCRMFIREGLLDPLSLALQNTMAGEGESAMEMKMKIIWILQVFAQVTQQDIHVRNAMGTRKVVRRLMKACEMLEPECLVQMLKAVKHLSMNATLLEVLQNANALDILIRVLDKQCSGPDGTEMSNHIFQTCYNLCRLNKSRQEEAAQAGILPCLKRVIETSSPLKQFALPILCDLAAAGKSCRTILWQHDGLKMYLKLLEDPYFQVSAFEAILSWLHDETARIEEQLLKSSSIEAILKVFLSAKANSFENLLDPFLKMARISHPITIALSRSSAFFRRITDRLLGTNSQPVMRLTLLRILRTTCEVHPNRSMLVEKYGLLGVVEKLSKRDSAVLVRELAREIVPVLKPGLKPASSGASANESYSRENSDGENSSAFEEEARSSSRFRAGSRASTSASTSASVSESESESSVLYGYPDRSMDWSGLDQPGKTDQEEVRPRNHRDSVGYRQRGSQKLKEKGRERERQQKRDLEFERAAEEDITATRANSSGLFLKDSLAPNPAKDAGGRKALAPKKVRRSTLDSAATPIGNGGRQLIVKSGHARGGSTSGRASLSLADTSASGTDLASSVASLSLTASTASTSGTVGIGDRVFTRENGSSGSVAAAAVTTTSGNSSSSAREVLRRPRTNTTGTASAAGAGGDSASQAPITSGSRPRLQPRAVRPAPRLTAPLLGEAPSSVLSPRPSPAPSPAPGTSPNPFYQNANSPLSQTVLNDPTQPPTQGPPQSQSRPPSQAAISPPVVNGVGTASGGVAARIKPRQKLGDIPWQAPGSAMPPTTTAANSTFAASLRRGNGNVPSKSLGHTRVKSGGGSSAASSGGSNNGTGAGNGNGSVRGWMKERPKERISQFGERDKNRVKGKEKERGNWTAPVQRTASLTALAETLNKEPSSSTITTISTTKMTTVGLDQWKEGNVSFGSVASVGSIGRVSGGGFASLAALGALKGSVIGAGDDGLTDDYDEDWDEDDHDTFK